MDINKITNSTQKFLQNAGSKTSDLSKANEACQEIADSIVDEKANIAASSLGKAMIEIQNAMGNKTAKAAIKKYPDEGLADARAKIKKAPLPKTYKTQVLNGINAEIENRYLASQTTGISHEKWADLLENGPEERKLRLQKKYSSKLASKKEADKIAQDVAQKAKRFDAQFIRHSFFLNTINKSLGDAKIDNKAMLEALNDPKTKETLQSLLEEGTQTGDAFEYLAFKTRIFLKLCSDEALQSLKMKRNNFSKSDDSKLFFECLNSELEYRASRNLSNKSAQESAQAILDYERLQKFKAEKAAKKENEFLTSALSYKSAKESAQAILDCEKIEAFNDGSMPPLRALAYIKLKKKFYDTDEDILKNIAEVYKEKYIELLLQQKTNKLNEAEELANRDFQAWFESLKKW